MRYLTILPAASLFFSAIADDAAILSSISSLEAEITFPTSIQAVLATAVPTSVQGQYADTTGRVLLFEELIENPPPWALALPQFVQDYLVNYIYPRINQVEELGEQLGDFGTSSVELLASGELATTKTTQMKTTTNVTSIKTTFVGTGTGIGSSTAQPTNGTIVTTGKLTASSTTGPTSTGLITAYSTAGAQPTGAIEAGVLGVVGILGLAMGF